MRGTTTGLHLGRAFGAGAGVLLATLLLAQEGAADDYAPPEEFVTLYQDFPSSAGPDSAAAMLNSAMETATDEGPLVLVTSTALYVYDADDRSLLATADFRLAPNSGFIELTALSHVGPAIAYLAKLKEIGDPRWEGGVDRLIDHLRDVRAVNAASEQNWLDRLNQPAFATRVDDIRAMVDYGAYMAGSYLTSVRDAGGEGFTTASVATDFLAADGDRYPIPFNNVMVGTFALAALSGQYAIYEAIAAADDIDWSNARVIIRAAPGVNYTAALTKGTQALFPLVHNLAGRAFDEDRILIVPFAEEKPTLGTDQLSEEDFDYYAVFIWQQAHSRREIAPVAFPSVETIFLPDRPALPGDYGYSSANDIDDFMVRMKHSFADPREALSNTVAFWVAGELYAKDWDPSRLDIPGLTAGFPDGIATYPADSPDF